MNANRRQAAGVYVSVSLLAATIVLFLYVFSVIPFETAGGGVRMIVRFESFFLLGLTLAAATVLAGLGRVDFLFADSPAGPDSTLAYLAARLRYTQTRVQEFPGELRIRIGQWTVVRLRVRPGSRGSVVTFRADLTPSAMGVVLLLVVLSPLALVSIPVTVAVFLAARSFALRRVAPLLPAEGPLPEPPKRDEVSVLLVSSLAEGHRIASEAYEAVRSAYHDTQGLVFTGAIFLWGILVIAAFTSFPDPDFGVRIWRSTWASLVAAVAFWIGIGVLVYRRFRERLQRYRHRAEELRSAWEREVSRAPYPVAGPSAFEVLAESSREVSEWLDAVRRTGPSRDPATGLLFMAMVFWPFYLIPAAVVLAVMGQYLAAAAVGAIGISVFAGFVAFYRRLKSRWEQVYREESARWSRRFDELTHRFDRFLEDL